MRTPEEIAERYENTVYSIVDVIRIAQIEAYNQALEDATKSVKLTYLCTEGHTDFSQKMVDKNSILKLKK